MSGQRNVGEMGESTLKVWAAQEGISAQKVNQDNTGWDFLLEISPVVSAEAEKEMALDLTPGSLRCFIQVKSSDQQHNTLPIKLDNLERFVKNPYPSFFLFLEFDHQNDCQRAYLVHVWDDLIRRVLHKLRELKPQERSRLHKKTLSIRYKPGLQLKSLDGKGLLEAIKSSVEVAPEAYTRRKDELVKTVGYDPSEYHLEMSILPPSNEGFDIEEYLTDFAIGLVPYLEIESAIVPDVRFGIRALEPLQEIAERSRFALTPASVGGGAILLSKPQGQEEIHIPVQTFAVWETRGSNSRPVKVRLAAPYFEFILSEKSSRTPRIIYTIPDLHEQVKLWDVAPLAKVIILSSEVYQKSHVDFEATFEEKPLASGQIFVNVPPDEDLIRLATAIRNTHKLMSRFDVAGDLKVKIGELLRQEGLILLAESVLDRTALMIRIHFTESQDSAEHIRNLLDSQLVCCPIIRDILIGEYRITVCIAAIGHVERVGDNELRMVTSDIQLRGKYIGLRHRERRFTMEELLDKTIEPYRETMRIVRFRDL